MKHIGLLEHKRDFVYQGRALTNRQLSYLKSLKIIESLYFLEIAT